MKELIKGGYGDGKPDSAFDRKQLQRGIKVEMEHTTDPRKAKEIAKDHLTEFPNYYIGLSRMEKRLESMQRIQPLLSKARRNLRGKLELGVMRQINRKSPKYDYLTVSWIDNGRKIKAEFYRRKGMKNWHFDSMVS